MNLDLQTHFSDDASAIITAKGRIDTLTYQTFQQLLDKTITESVTTVTINLKDVDYVSSSGIRAFIIAQKKMNQFSGTLILKECDPNVKMVFDVSGLTSLFVFE